MSIQPSSDRKDPVVSSFPTKAAEAEADGAIAAQRGAWGGQLEFLLTLVGFAVGLGNVWRFPYLAYDNGGGAFLIPYVISLVFLGIPLFYLECSLGQFASQGVLTLWQRLAPLSKGVGYGAVIVSTVIIIYYQVIVAWALYFFFASMNSELPWTRCNQTWNTEYCVEDYRANMSLPFNKSLMKSPSEEYFYNNILGISSGIEEFGGIRWQLALLLMFSWFIIFLVIIKGVASLGKASYFISLFPYVLLTVMLVKGATLPGAVNGIIYYIKPEWHRLKELKVWSTAANQIFYSLGVSLGGLFAMSSFNKFNNNVLRDAIVVPLINCSTSLYAGFVIFSVLGYMATRKAVPIKDVALSGPGLVFVVYPEGLATMPVAPLWSVLFFLMMVNLGMSSQFSTIESVITAFIDEFPETLGVGYRPMLLRGGFCVLGFLLGLSFVTNGGYYLFQIFDNYSGGYPLLVVGLLEILAVVIIYGLKRFSEDICLMLGKKPSYFFIGCWVFITPALVIVVTVLKLIGEERLKLKDYLFPDWAMAIAYTVAGVPIAVMVFHFLINLVVRACRGGLEAVKAGFRPLPNWGPALPENRTGRYAPPKPAEEMITPNQEVMPGYDNTGFEQETALDATAIPPPYDEVHKF